MSDTLTADAAALLARMADADVATLTDPERIDLIAILERLKGAAAGCQARTTVAFADSERRIDAARGVRPEAQGRGVAIQVGLAMHVSPARARRFVGFAHALPEMRHIEAALAAGETSEYRAFLVAKETMCLSREDRAVVDAELAARPGGIGALSDGTAEGLARAIGQRLDPAAAVKRNSDAVKGRRVSLRAAPDGMCRLSGVLPLTAGVSVFGALSRAAATAHARGDDRSRGAVMADELIDRVLGHGAATDGGVEARSARTSTTKEQGPAPTTEDAEGRGSRDGRCATSSTTEESAGSSGGGFEARCARTSTTEAEEGGRVVEEGRSPVTRPPDRASDRPSAGVNDVLVNLVMTDATLLGSDDETAHHEPAQVASALGVHGTIPADLARGVVRDAARVWVRRLYADPKTGDLVAMDTRAELFDGALRKLLVLRDQRCRTPWCDGPVRHTDHVTRRRHHGRTSLKNGQGLCEACNHAKEAVDLHQEARRDGSIVTTTPTGHEYRSHEPRPPGPSPPTRIDWSVAERWVLEQMPA